MPGGKLRGELWIKKIPSVYTQDQVSKWLSCIGYPHPIEQFDPNLENLKLLMHLQLTTFPFENTQMHYTPEHSMDISPEGLYKRLVEEKLGASYCFGNNGVFAEMIRGLGYRAYTGAGRINTGPPSAPPSYLAFVHKVIFVQPIDGSNATYFMDVSGGGSSVTQPILLEEGASVVGATPSEKHTLVKSVRADTSLATSLTDTNAVDPKVEWILTVTQLKRTKETTERILYSFIEDEFFPVDYETANKGVYTSTNDIFWEGIVCSKYFWLNEDEEDEVKHKQGTLFSQTVTKKPLGRLSMEGRTVKRHIGNRSEVIRTMKTELERLDVLKEVFAIKVSPESIKYLAGRPPAFEDSAKE